MKGVSIMEPRKQDLSQTPQARPSEKKRRFRLVKLDEQRFQMNRLEERIAPTLVGGTGHVCQGWTLSCYCPTVVPHVCHH
jgi:hypothetical protein